jgi:hypothetical protein
MSCTGRKNRRAPATRPSLRRSLPFRQRLQYDEDETGIGLAAAGKGDDGFDRRIAPDDGDEPGHLFFHRLERDALIGLDAADHPPGVLLGKKSFGDDVEQSESKAQGQEQAQHDQPRPLQGPAQRAFIGAERGGEDPLGDMVEPPLPLRAAVVEQTGAHHRRRRQ